MYPTAQSVPMLKSKEIVLLLSYISIYILGQTFNFVLRQFDGLACWDGDCSLFLLTAVPGWDKKHQSSLGYSSNDIFLEFDPLCTTFAKSQSFLKKWWTKEAVIFIVIGLSSQNLYSRINPTPSYLPSFDIDCLGITSLESFV